LSEQWRLLPLSNHFDQNQFHETKTTIVRIHLKVRYGRFGEEQVIPRVEVTLSSTSLLMLDSELRRIHLETHRSKYRLSKWKLFHFTKLKAEDGEFLSLEWAVILSTDVIRHWNAANHKHQFQSQQSNSQNSEIMRPFPFTERTRVD
jgi:hypothetical protein